MSDKQYTEGVCDDGAAILFDGVMLPIGEIIRLLNARQELIDQCESMKFERDEAREKHGCVLTVRECRAIVNRLDAQETYGEVNHFSFLNAFDKLQKGANVEVKQEILDA